MPAPPVIKVTQVENSPCASTTSYKGNPGRELTLRQHHESGNDDDDECERLDDGEDVLDARRSLHTRAVHERQKRCK